MDEARRLELLAKTPLGRQALEAGVAGFSGQGRDDHGHYAGEDGGGPCQHGHGGGKEAGEKGDAVASLGKAHRGLLEAAAATHHGVVSVLSGGGKGAKGAVRSHHNTRQREAASRLVELGLLEKVGSHQSTDVKSGNVMHWTETSYRLTPKGREAVAALKGGEGAKG